MSVLIKFIWDRMCCSRTSAKSITEECVVSNAGLLKYLLSKSQVAIELATNGPVSLEDLLMAYSRDGHLYPEAMETDDKFTHIIGLLKLLPGLEIDTYNYRVRPYSDKKEGYSSLVGLSYEDVVELCKIADYLQMPDIMCARLARIINAEYEVDKPVETDTFEEIAAREIEKRNQWGPMFGYKSLTVTSKHGLEYAKWLINKGAQLTSETFEEAMYTNSVECLDYFHSINCPFDCDDGIQCAIESGAFEAVKWLYEKDQFRRRMIKMDKPGSIYDGLCNYAPNLEMLKWLHEHGFRLTDKVYKRESHTLVECLEYAYAAGCPFGEKAYSGSWGNLEHLIWLYKHGFHFTDETCRTNLELICGRRNNA